MERTARENSAGTKRSSCCSGSWCPSEPCLSAAEARTASYILLKNPEFFGECDWKSEEQEVGRHSDRSPLGSGLCIDRTTPRNQTSQS